MGGERKYRWERRRERNSSREIARQFQSFWGFEIILLILIFAFWLIFARLFQIYAVIWSPCSEAAASFGTMKGAAFSAFDILVWICGAAAIFWLAITVAYWKTLRRSKSGLVHVSLLICLLLLGSNFRLMRVDNNIPPDGTMVVRQMVVDRASGQEKYVPLLSFTDEFGAWHLGKPERNTYLFEWSNNLQHCVWLDRNLIMDGGYAKIPGYSLLSKDEQIAAGTSFVQNWEFRDAPGVEMSFWRNLRFLISESAGQTSPLERLKAKQEYRPLLPEERERFLQKQNCLKENRFEADAQKRCTFYWVVDLDAYYADWERQEGKWWRLDPDP